MLKTIWSLLSSGWTKFWAWAGPKLAPHKGKIITVLCVLVALAVVLTMAYCAGKRSVQPAAVNVAAGEKVVKSIEGAIDEHYIPPKPGAEDGFYDYLIFTYFHPDGVLDPSKGN
jgi:hypothetical protein